MKIFVTGATGVLGRRVLPLLVAEGHDVTAIARTPEKASTVEALGVTPSNASLFDADSLRAALPGHDAVLNLATHIPSLTKASLPGAWKENDRIRREGSRHLVDAALEAGVGRHVQESITFVYPDRGSEWIDESVETDAGVLMQSSALAEAQAQRLTDAGGVGVVLRFAAFYGPDASHTRDYVRFARRGMAPVVGAPEAYVSHIHLDDAAAAAVAALGLPAGLYNVAEDDPITKGELAEVAAAVVGRSRLSFAAAKASRLAGKKSEPLRRSQRIANRKLRAASSWSPTYVSIREGWPIVADQIERESSHA
jgi:nucleoside-diphosphate-sugar epimerase